MLRFSLDHVQCTHTLFGGFKIRGGACASMCRHPASREVTSRGGGGGDGKLAVDDDVKLFVCLAEGFAVNRCRVTYYLIKCGEVGWCWYIPYRQS